VTEMLEYRVGRLNEDTWIIGRYVNEVTGHVLMVLHPDLFHGEKRVQFKFEMGFLGISMAPPASHLYKLLERMPGKGVVVFYEAVSYIAGDCEWTGEGIIFEPDWSRVAPGKLKMTIDITAQKPVEVLIDRADLLTAIGEMSR